MSNTAHAPRWLKFVKLKTNFFDLLSAQAQTTSDGITALKDWVEAGMTEQCNRVHDLEHKGDDEKQKLERELHDNFVTPFDREDIYDISAMLDQILNGTKKLVKDIEFDRGIIISANTSDEPDDAREEDKLCTKEAHPKLNPETDERLLQMCKGLAKGTDDLVNAVKSLEHELSSCCEHANHARKTQTRIANLHRASMKELYEQGDAIRLVRKKHVYDQVQIIAERIEILGEKLLHVSVKLG
ncbi:MAG TPA: DUF47 family protein [Drouetiella sp.]